MNVTQRYTQPTSLLLFTPVRHLRSSLIFYIYIKQTGIVYKKCGISLGTLTMDCYHCLDTIIAFSYLQQTKMNHSNWFYKVFIFVEPRPSYATSGISKCNWRQVWVFNYSFINKFRCWFVLSVFFKALRHLRYLVPKT